MIRTKLAKKILTKKEQKHLTESGIISMAGMKRQIEHMKRLDHEKPGQVCWECWFIAKKLGVK